jgi:hypothetical protein
VSFSVSANALRNNVSSPSPPWLLLLAPQAARLNLQYVRDAVVLPSLTWCFQRTPVAKRVQPVIRLRQVCCSRCAKQLTRDPNQEPCDKQELKKCTRCARLHKECRAFPVEFNSRFNLLLRTRERLPRDADGDSDEVAAWTLAQREFVRDLEAYVRQQAKHGGTHKPKGDELTLLLIGSIDRVGTAVEGLLDLARSAVSSSDSRYAVALTSSR